MISREPAIGLRIPMLARSYPHFGPRIPRSLKPSRAMPTPTELALLVSDPAAFMRAYAVRWAGKGPDNQAPITAALIDGTGDSQARVRTGSKFLGVGNAKADAKSFILRDTNFPHWQIDDPGTLTFPAVWSGYVAGQAANAVLPNAGGPNIMLTPEFTGCAAVCHTNADGSATFSHYNLLKENGKETLDIAQMRAAAEGTYDNGFIPMTKESQRGFAKVATNGVRSTVIGFRRHRLLGVLGAAPREQTRRLENDQHAGTSRAATAIAAAAQRQSGRPQCARPDRSEPLMLPNITRAASPRRACASGPPCRAPARAASRREPRAAQRAREPRVVAHRPVHDRPAGAERGHRGAMPRVAYSACVLGHEHRRRGRCRCRA